MNNVLILGDGKLGTEIRNQTNWDYISRKKDGFDFTDLFSYIDLMYGYDQILNCIACTDTYSEEREKHWGVNFKAVIDLTDYCYKTDKKLIHISTDYIYANSKIGVTEDEIPIHFETWYAYTKLLGDGYIQCKLKNYLLIRTSFKPNPFPYPEAVTQYGNFDYIDIISKLIIKLINKNAVGIYNAGTERKSMLDLARRTNPKVLWSYKKIHPSMPSSLIMNINKMEEFLNE